MKEKFLFLTLFIYSTTFSQTNINLFDVTLINGNPTVNFGIEQQFNKYQATLLIPYSDALYTENKEAGAKRFFNARVGYFIMKEEGDSKTKTNTIRYKVKHIKSGRIENRTDSYNYEVTPGFAVLCGADYYQTFVETDKKKTNLIANDNLTVGSIFSKIYYTATTEATTTRYFIDLSYGLLMNLSNSINKDTDFRRLTLRLGVDLYLFDFFSVKVCVGKAPGINGKNGWATLVNIGIPLGFF